MTRRAFSAFCSPLVVVVLGVGMFIPPQAFSAADSCPNAAVRAQQGATGLPGCRAYEIVNPSGVDFGEANRVSQITNDGNAVAFMSPLPDDRAFADPFGATFVARRGPSGWTSVSADGRFRQSSSGSNLVSPRVFSSDLSRFLFNTTVPFADIDDPASNDLYVAQVGTGDVTQVTAGLGVGVGPAFGANEDLSEVVVQSASDVKPPTPGNPNPTPYPGGLYVVGGRTVEAVDGSTSTAGYGALRGFGVGDENQGFNERKSDFWVERGATHAISDDAKRIYIYDQGNTQVGPGNAIRMRDRRSDPPRTVQVSASHRTGDVGTLHGGTFLSASHDGSTAYFESSAQLTDDATPGGGIYRFDLATESVTQITPASDDPTGLHLTAALVSDDQSHIYFTSPSVLAVGAQPGDLNSYVWSSAGVRFIASVAPGGRVVRVTPDGKYALLETTASLNGANNAGHKSLYRYSFDADDLVCVSCRPNGAPSNGTAEIETQSTGFPATDVSHSRALTFNGDVVFATNDRLVPEDLTPAQDVYLYSDGKPSLLTSGRGDADSFIGDVSDDGKNIFVITRDALVGADQDAAEFDVYDVRVDGGFSESGTPDPPCRADECQGPPTVPTADPAPGSSRVTGPGNVPASAPASGPAKIVKVAKLSPAERRTLARTGKISLSVDVAGGGTLAVRGRATVGGATTVVGRASDIVLKKAKTTVKLRFRLSPTARRQLARRGRLRITISASLSGLKKTANSTVQLSASR